MQLIVDSEAALDIKRDMSAIEDVHTEKVVNGDIEQLLKTCNGNKENIEDFKVITNDAKNKQIANSDIETLPNLPIDVKTEKTEEESSIEVANKEETCESIVPETNSEQNGVSQSNGTDEEFQSITKNPENEKEPEETVQEDIVEDEEDIISLKQEPLDETSVSDIHSVKVEPETDEIKISEDLSVTKGDSEVKEKPTETHTTPWSFSDAVTEEPIPDVKLEKQTNTIKIEDNSLKCCGNEEIPKESSDIKEISKESSDNEEKHKQSSDNVNIPKESPDNKEIPKESTEDNKKKIEIEVPVDDSTKVLSNNNAGNSPPIVLKDDMDVDEVVEVEKNEQQLTAPQTNETSPTLVSSIKPILCKLSNTLDILSDDEEEPPVEETPKVEEINDKQCINIEDDDDIMLIDEDISKTETPDTVDISKKDNAPSKPEDKTDSETGEVKVEETVDLFTQTDAKG